MARAGVSLGSRCCLEEPHRFRPKTAEPAPPPGEGLIGAACRRLSSHRVAGAGASTGGPLTDFGRRRPNLPLPSERVKIGIPADQGLMHTAALRLPPKTAQPRIESGEGSAYPTGRDEEVLALRCEVARKPRLRGVNLDNSRAPSAV